MSFSDILAPEGMMDEGFVEVNWSMEHTDLLDMIMILWIEKMVSKLPNSVRQMFYI